MGVRGSPVRGSVKYSVTKVKFVCNCMFAEKKENKNFSSKPEVPGPKGVHGQ